MDRRHLGGVLGQDAVRLDCHTAGVGGEAESLHPKRRCRAGWRRRASWVVRTRVLSMTRTFPGTGVPEHALGVDDNRVYVDHGLTGRRNRERPGLRKPSLPAAKATSRSQQTRPARPIRSRRSRSLSRTNQPRRPTTSAAPSTTRTLTAPGIWRACCIIWADSSTASERVRRGNLETPLQAHRRSPSELAPSNHAWRRVVARAAGRASRSRSSVRRSRTTTYSGPSGPTQHSPRACGTSSVRTLTSGSTRKGLSTPSGPATAPRSRQGQPLSVNTIASGAECRASLNASRAATSLGGQWAGLSSGAARTGRAGTSSPRACKR